MNVLTTFSRASASAFAAYFGAHSQYEAATHAYSSSVLLHHPNDEASRQAAAALDIACKALACASLTLRQQHEAEVVRLGLDELVDEDHG